jgi:putative endonuclease
VPLPSELRLGKPASLPRREGCGSSSCVHDHAHSSLILRGSGGRRRHFNALRVVSGLLGSADMLAPKRFVYVLRSRLDPARYYTGITSDLQRRLDTHNSGGSHHTAALRPWHLVVSLEFSGEQHALLFEQYLKTGSGRAFAKRHFL